MLTLLPVKSYFEKLTLLILDSNATDRSSYSIRFCIYRINICTESKIFKTFPLRRRSYPAPKLATELLLNWAVHPFVSEASFAVGNRPPWWVSFLGNLTSETNSRCQCYHFVPYVTCKDGLIWKSLLQLRMVSWIECNHFELNWIELNWHWYFWILFIIVIWSENTILTTSPNDQKMKNVSEFRLILVQGEDYGSNKGDYSHTDSKVRGKN